MKRLGIGVFLSLAFFLLAYFVLCFASAHAQTVYITQTLATLRLNAVACNAAAATRSTGWMQADTRRSIILDVTMVDANADETSVDMTCSTSRSSAGTNPHTIDVITTTSATGVMTKLPATWHEVATGGGAPCGTSPCGWTTDITNIPAPFIQCVFVCNGAVAAADTLTVYSRGINP